MTYEIRSTSFHSLALENGRLAINEINRGDAETARSHAQLAASWARMILANQ